MTLDEIPIINLNIRTKELDAPPPRLGRRETEPHSEEVSYLHDVLSVNFPNCRTISDLHHYFILNNIKIDILYDISFFIDWEFNDGALDSYDAAQFGNRIPDLVVNILSKSTYMNDLTNIKEFSLRLGIPYYIIFAPFNISAPAFNPPFLRVYELNRNNAKYNEITLNHVAIIEGEDKINEKYIVNPGDGLPFNVGLMERKRRLYDGSKLYRMVVLDKSKENRLLVRWGREKDRASKEKERANNLEKLLEKYKEKFGDLN
ncbi:MAG: hypothetical protein ACTSU2_04755 [Promethearchaeota archaeon]